MKCLLFFTVVLIVCQAQPQPPPPPKLSESFLAEFIVLRPRQAAFISGLGAWARNFEKGQTLEKMELKFTSHQVRREHLRFFDTKKEYSVQFGDAGANCTEGTIPEQQSMPLAWHWLENAHYVVYHEPGLNVTRDSWVEHTHLGSTRLVVRQSAPETPYLLIRVDNAGDQEQWEFVKYEAQDPPADVFEVPAACRVK